MRFIKKRLHFPPWTSCILFFILHISTTVYAQSTDKPNIIFILLDDAGYDDFIQRELIRPNIDRLAKQSLRYDNYYTAPMCSPTRTGLLTGQYPARFGLQWVYGSKSHRGIDQSQVTLVDALKQNGYLTAHFGKWHAGKGESYEMIDFGYQHIAATNGVVGHGYMNPQITHTDGNIEKFPGQHTTDVITDQVLGYLETQSNQSTPFFINLWYHAPHVPLQPAKRWLNRYDAQDKYRKYKALFSQADENIGRILDFLDTNPALRDNTIIMLASDNGGIEGAAENNGGLRGFKSDVFEGGIKSPLFVRWPNRIQPGTTDTLITTQDIFPTLAGLTNSQIKTSIDGMDLSEDMLLYPKSKDSAPRSSLFWMHKVAGGLPKAAKFQPSLAQLSWAVREENWKLVYEPLDAEQAMLFDISIDPGENRDLASEHPELVERLFKAYMTWKTQVSELPLQISDASPAVMVTNGSHYTFPDGKRKTANIALMHNPLQEVHDLDMTFVTSIETHTKSVKNQSIVAKEGAWSFGTDAKGRLKLTLIGPKGKAKVIKTKQQLQPGAKYTVAFSVVGMKKVANYARIFMSEENQDQVALAGEGRGVRAIRGTDAPITLGGQNPVAAIITPRLFMSPFSAAELNQL